jgi:hypothetical protein
VDVVGVGVDVVGVGLCVVRMVVGRLGVFSVVVVVVGVV